MLGSLGTLGNFQLDGNITWRDNMSIALEEFSQNASLSLLSGLIIVSNPGVPKLLQSVTKTCTYTFTAYRYTPYRLFLTYGVAVFVTTICVIWGSVALRHNGIEESMDFSLILRAILNEKMYYAKERLDMDTILKVDQSAGEGLVPLLS